MKKLTCTIMALMMIMLSGCQVFAQEQAQVQEFHTTDIGEFGLSISLPKEAVENYTLEISAQIEPETAASFEEATIMLPFTYYFPELNEMYERGDELTYEIVEEMSRELCEMQIYPEAKFDERLKAGETFEQITSLLNCEELGRQDAHVYLFGEHPENAEGMSDTTKALYEELRGQMPEMKKRLKLIPIVAMQPADASTIEAGTAISLEGTDMDGNPVNTAELFKQAKLTMVNIWATFCGPCIDEMPDLGKMAKAMPEGSQLIGVVTDWQGNEDLAKEILEKSGADFQQIFPDINKSAILQSVVAIPTTLFVDQDGNLVGEPVVGKRSEADYIQAIEDRLK